MASVTQTLNGTTPLTFAIPGAVGRVKITMLSAGPEAWVTSDGTAPINPSSTTDTDISQRYLPAVAGSQIIITPTLYGDHFAAPTLNLASTGSPVLLIEW
jgi:hypothetical protein